MSYRFVTCLRALSAIALIALLTSPGALAQTRNVSFLHGINSEAGTWDNAINSLSAEYNISTTAGTYDSDQTIPQIASANYTTAVASNSVVVAHSMGGMVARQMVQTNGTGRVSSLITTGTPHLGAPIAYALLNTNNDGVWIRDLVIDLAAGWDPFGLGPAGDFIAETLASDLIGGVVGYFNGIDDLQSLEDLIPGSPFLSTINTPSGAHPYGLPSAHYAIGGAEDWNTPWRLIGHELGSEEFLVRVNSALQGFYLYGAVWAANNADWYRNAYNETGDFYYFNEMLWWQASSNGFFHGWWSLRYLQQARWSAYITGSLTPYGPWDSEDGIVPLKSQQPTFVNPNRYIDAPGMNHLQETNQSAGISAISNAFRKPDIDVPETSTGTGGTGTGGTGTGGTGTGGGGTGGGCEDIPLRSAGPDPGGTASFIPPPPCEPHDPP